MKTKYELSVYFIYRDGTPGGLLRSIHTSRKAANDQLTANLKWLIIKNHTITATDILVIEMA